ncbi:hypothetical protein BKA62DRAFT_787419 [Auriculariales sp. MPI-PUGE-AT-0066]|nr:hypothetical protein BKA62DRAFT_787419 [Auriculariales sp. MPI-PUGE-AT-0066]
MLSSAGSRLPDEALVCILRFLNLKDRLQAMYVSQRWKFAALAPAAWSSVDLRGLSNCDPDLLRTLLTKSYRAPLDIFCSSDECFPLQVIETLCTEISRIEHLRLDAVTHWNDTRAISIFGQPAPLLKTFIYAPSSWYEKSNVAVLPSIMWPGAGSKIRRLELGAFSLTTADSPRPILTLRTFAGILVPELSDARNIFQYFPNIVSLKLHLCATACVSMLPQGSYPSSLQHLELRCVEGPIEWAGTLEQLPFSLKVLNIWSVRTIRPCLDLMERLSSGQSWWLNGIYESSMDGKELYIQLGCDAAALHFRLVYGYAQNCDLFDQLGMALEDKHHLTRLEMYEDQLYTLIQTPTKLSSLLHLIVRCSYMETRDSSANKIEIVRPTTKDGSGVESKKPGSLIVAPRLETLTVHIFWDWNPQEGVHWFARCLHRQLPIWVKFDADRLKAVSLIGPGVQAWAGQYSSHRLRRIAEDIFVKEESDGEPVELNERLGDEDGDDEADDSDEEFIYERLSTVDEGKESTQDPE